MKETAQDFQDFFRMEKSIITNENVKSLKQATDDHIAESIIYSICYQHQYDLFGFGRIDPETFGKEFGFSRSYLFRPVDKPYQQQIEPNLYAMEKVNTGREISMNKYRYETRIENALYVLANVPLTRMTTIIDDNNKLVRKIEFKHIIKELCIEMDKNTGKKTYVYKLEEDFRRNLSSFYLNTSKQTLVKLRKSGLVSLYQLILRIKEAVFAKGETSTTKDNTPKFAYLVEIAGISKNLSPTHQKAKLNNAFRKIEECSSIVYDVEWVKDDVTNERFVPIFHFVPMLGEEPGSESLYASHKKKETRINVIAIEFVHNLLSACPEQTYENYVNGENEKKFINWITSDNYVTKQILEKQLLMSYINVGIENIPKNLTERISRLQDLAKKNRIDDILSWIQEIVKL